MTYVVAQAAVEVKWDWQVAWDFLPIVAKGLWVTVRATLVGTIIAMILGLILAVLRRSPRWYIRLPTIAVIEFVRSTPLLIQLFFIFFVLPGFGVTLSPFAALSIGLGIHYGSYTSESYRAGIESVGRGQWDAAVAINLPTATMWTSVILPQAIPTVIPALGNYLLAMLKDAPLGSAISVVGVLAAAKGLASLTFRVTEAFTLVGILFLAVSLPSAIFVRYLERRYGFTRT